MTKKILANERQRKVAKRNDDEYDCEANHATNGEEKNSTRAVQF